MLNILTKYGIRNVAAHQDGRPNLLVTDDGRQFKVRPTVVFGLQPSLFIFETVGYFAKGVPCESAH